MTWAAPYLDAAGFYIYTPSNAGESPSNKTTVIIYVSDGTGDNSNAGTNLAAPKKSIMDTQKYTGCSPSTAGSLAEGAEYTSANSSRFRSTVSQSGATLYFYPYSQEAAPAASGTLTRVSGTGPNSITYTGTLREDGGIHAMATANSGGISSVGWMMLKCGDTFTNQSFEQDLESNYPYYGFSADESILYAAYDPSITTTDSWGTYATPWPSTTVLARPYIPNSRAFIMVRTLGATGYGLTSGGNNSIWLGIKGYGGNGACFAFLSGINPVTFARVEDCYLTGFGYGVFGFSPGLQCYRCVIVTNTGQGIDTAGYPASVYGTTYSAQVIECTVDNNGDGGGLTHNFYMNGDIDPFFWTAPGPAFISGNIVCRDPGGNSQFRCGGTIYNNAWIANPSSIGALGNPGINTTTTTEFSYNVLINPTSSGIAELNTNYYISNQFNYGTIGVDNNIFCHENAPCDYAIDVYSGSVGFSYSNNIFYKWNAASPANLVVTPAAGGINRIGSITAGSGYTDQAIPITSITTTTGLSNAVVIAYVHIASFTTPVLYPWRGIIPGTELHAREGYVYIDDISAGSSNNAIGTALNGQIFRVYAYESNGYLQLQGTIPALAGLTWGINGTGGNVYIPYLGRNTTGGSGSGFRCDVHVAHGQVKGIGFGTDADLYWNFAVGSISVSPGATYTNNGTTFTVINYVTNGGGSFTLITDYTYGANDPSGNTLVRTSGAGTGPATITFSAAITPNMPISVRGAGYTTSDTGITTNGTSLPVPGGTGFSFAVSGITNAVSASGNQVYPSGPAPGTWPFPERDSGTYYNYLFGGTGATYVDFCNRALLQAKNNWNALMMAASFNDYMRQGFGEPMIGSAYATSQSGGSTFPILNGPLWLRLHQ